MADDRRALQIFEQALDVSVERRAGFLAEICEHDEQLLRDVESLLQTHEASNAFLPEEAPQGREDFSSISTGLARFVDHEFRDMLDQHPTVIAQLSQQNSYENIPTQLGNYILGDEIGRGGMGVVYEARHQTMRRRVALKVLRSSHSSQGDQLERFLREARSAGRLHHSNIVPVFEVGVDSGVHFYAMQYIHGDNLDVVIDELKRLQTLPQKPDREEYTEGTHGAAQCLISGEFEAYRVDEGSDQQNGAPRPDETLQQADLSANDEKESSDSSSLRNVGHPDDNYFHRVARIGLQVTEALAYAHEHGVLHRDIKPSNLILDSAGTVWVTDFGLATSQGEELTQTGDVIGTLRYMAPERFRGEADERSDIYSFGLTLYELCTLRPAFDQNDRAELVRQVTHDVPLRPSQLASDIPKDLETIISRCIARAPSSRYVNAHKVADDLRLFLEDRPILARRVSFSEKAWRWCRRNPVLASMISMVAALLVLVTCGSIAFALRTQEYNETLIEKTLIATRAQTRMQQAYEGERLARLAEKRALEESSLNLYRALFRQIQAERQNPLTTRREDTLLALKEAARLLPTVPILEQSIAEERLRLRTEAAAIYGQIDLSVDSEKLVATHLTTGVTFSPKYDRYAVSTGYIEVYRSGDLEPFTKLSQHNYRATDFEFSQDGRYLAALHRVGKLRPRYVRVWDLERHSLLLDVEISVSQIRFSSSSDLQTPPHLAVVSTESTVTVFPDCNEERRVDHVFENSVRGADFSQTGTSLFVVGDFPSLEEWSFQDDTTVGVSLPAPAGSVDCGSDQNTIAVGLQSGEIDILDLGKIDEPVAVLRGHSNGIHSLSLSADGTLVTSSSWDGSTRLWGIPEKREIKRLESTRLRTGFSLDSNYFSCITDDREVLVHRVVRNHPKRVCVDRYHLPRRNDVAIHPKNSRIAVTATSGYVEFWDLKSGTIINPLKTERAFDARISPDGTRMLTSGRHGLRLWSLVISEAGPDHEALTVTCALERSLTEQDTYQMDCTADLERVAFVTPDKNVIIADTNRFEQKQVLTSETGFYKVALSPNGKWLATLTNEGWHLAIWNADTGLRVEEFGSNVRATGIAFSPDNLWLAANGVKDRFLWSVTDWKQRLQVPSDGRFSGDVCFSPDSQMLAMPHDRNTLELIDRATFDPLILLTSSGPRDRETVAFSSDGKQLITTCGTDFEVWDLVELRHQLRELNLDWKEPEPTDSTAPLPLKD